MTFETYHFASKISINGTVESKVVQELEELPPEIQKLFQTTGLTLIALQIDTGNGMVAAVYKKVNE